MDEKSILDALLEEQNGYIRLVDAQNKGVSKYAVLDYVHRNEMEKVAPGIYISADTWEDRLYSLQLRNRKIIFSHETALYIHNLSDREPFSPVITVVRGYNAKHLKDIGVVVHTVRPEWLEIGLTMAQTFAGNSVRIYDRERCICDIIKNKKRMDIQVFQMAITFYFSDKEKNIHNLMEYAQMMGISEKVRQYTEVLL
ncbi:MAG: type IV toxin-antitoxin system AbiEi family antitoxin domain-containing protein [Lachnospiraceae bacterium]|nr:type IV toxin-antitoxin system AbiEi family antitoxin domain-containing protein [Lachnospiraceae bacterium]